MQQTENTETMYGVKVKNEIIVIEMQRCQMC